MGKDVTVKVTGVSMGVQAKLSEPGENPKRDISQLKAHRAFLKPPQDKS